MVVQLTLLPALLLAVGRKPFWPRVPHFGDSGTDETHGAYRRLGERIAVRPRRVWVGTIALLVVLSVGLLNFSTGLTQGNSFRDDVEAIAGQELVEKAFPAGQSAPTDVVVSDPSKVAAVTAALKSVDGVASVVPTPFKSSDGVLLAAFLESDPYSTRRSTSFQASGRRRGAPIRTPWSAARPPSRRTCAMPARMTRCC